MSGDAIRLVGQIDNTMFQYLTRQIALRPVHTVVISSVGGEDESAIAIAALLQQHHMKIVVYRACVSACASYLFLAAPERFICPHALVMFHHTASSRLKLASNYSGLRTPPQYKVVSDQAESLLKRNQISLMLLLQPQLEIHTVCYKFLEKDHVASIGYEADYSLWVPSKEFMNHAGVAFGGYWPDGYEHFVYDLHYDFRSIRNAGIAFGGPAVPLNSKALDDEYSKIPMCTA